MIRHPTRAEQLEHDQLEHDQLQHGQIDLPYWHNSNARNDVYNVYICHVAQRSKTQLASLLIGDTAETKWQIVWQACPIALNPLQRVVVSALFLFIDLVG